MTYDLPPDGPEVKTIITIGFRESGDKKQFECAERVAMRFVGGFTVITVDPGRQFIFNSADVTEITVDDTGTLPE